MASNEDDNFGRMQHLIDEMDRSNQRINLFSEKFDIEELGQESTVKHLSPLGRQFDHLDDVYRSEESDGTSGHEIPPSQFSKNLEDSGCEEVINSAIAEVSKDFLAGLQTSGTQNQCGDSDESRISSDTDFKLIGGMPSYARYPETAAGLSDTDWNPYGTESDNNQSPHSQSAQSLSKELKSNATTPFLPILSSTGLNAITPNSDDKVLSVNSQSHLSDIKEISERSSLARQDLRPDVSDEIAHLTRKADWAITPQRGRRQQPSSLLSQITKGLEQDKLLPYEKGTFKIGHGDTSPKESVSSDEEKKMIASTSSTGYSSATSVVKTNIEFNREKTAQDIPKSQHISVFERAKLMGIPEDILFDRANKNKAHFTNGRSWKEKVSSGGLSDYDSDDPLAHKVQHILSETAYLSSGAEKSNYNKPTVDYNRLKKDLQEIQDNLESLSSGSPADLKKQLGGSPLSSDKGGDTPSTASTPDRNSNSPVWDFAEVIGSLASRIQPSSCHSKKCVMKRASLNSDGDETRSSDSSHKSEDQIAVPESLKSNLRDSHTSRDIDQMLSTFQDQRHQLESRYQQLSNQGLAEKVFRILTNQDPESQANGILSEVSAEEKEMRAKMVLKQHAKDFNFSSNSSLMEDSNRSLGLPDDIRKKLDLSGISSVDSSKVFDRSSFNLPSSSKGFSAFDDAKRFLSSQMAKASERTFNHSIEMKYPQSIQCYPLFMDKSDKENGEKLKVTEDKDSGPPNAVTREETATEIHKKDISSSQQDKDKADISPEELLGKEKHESSSSSYPGSLSKSKEKYRPYRPPGSKEVYYTESDTASVADSVTTMESTHIGSDDAAGPHLPLSAYGSRKDAPNVDGIYGTRKNLSTVQEGTEPSSVEDKSSQDGKENKTSQIQTKETSSRYSQPGVPSHQESNNGRLGQAVTTDRYSTSIWAKREDQPNIPHAAKREEKSEQRVSANMLSHSEPVSLTHSVSAARRNARWANRLEEQNPDLADQVERNVTRGRLYEHIPSQRPSRCIGRDGAEATREDQNSASLRDDFTLPTNAFVSQGRDSPVESEPMSLRIKLAYTDTNKTCERSPEKEESFRRYGSGLQSQAANEDYNFRISERNHYESDERFLRHQNLVRSASDENLNSTQRDVRLSPAFRRALSPELMTSIGSRSPILGRSIERSLARPPSDYPSKLETNHSTSPVDRRPYSLSDPPTFLARERSLSPRQYVTSHRNEQRGQPPAYTRDLSPSPQDKILSHDGRSRNQRTNFDRYQTAEKRQNSMDSYAPRQPSPTSFTRRRQAVERRQDDSDRFTLRQCSPESVIKRKVELTLEGMSSESEADKEIDSEPMSKRAQLLRDALSHEHEPSINPDINEMWDQFKAYNESDDSSINTARMEAVADLLKSPSTHLVSQYLKEREEYRIERQERVEREKEKRMKEQVKVRKSSSSEDDLNERYHDLLMAKEEERMKRRSAKKKKGKNGEPAKVSDAANEKKKVEDKCTESLYSIPEDRSFEQSPGKLSSGLKSKPHVSSQPNVIDPNMIKLRDKISNQRNKVNRDMMKEIVKIEKLKKLEDLLKAKRNGKITSQMLEQQLEELSSTSQTISDNSQDNVKSMEPNFTVLSDDSTTAKDSSGEMRMWKMRKEKRHKDFEMVGEHEDKLRSKNSSSNNNKENKFKWKATDPPKELQHQSEMKLLKLVKEGYLTADEAYKVALSRTGHDKVHLAEDMSGTLSENDSSFGSSRPHKFYSPYSRSPTFSSQIRHVPKLKFSDSLIDDSFNNGSYWLGNEKQAQRNEGNFRQSNLESRSSQHSKFSVKQRTEREDRNNRFASSMSGIYKRERGRPRSQSPSNVTRQRHGGQRRVLLSSHQSPIRSHSYSPSRPAKDASNFPVKGKHGHYSRGRKSQSENDPSNSKKDFNPGIAWHIDMNSPPDQWKEPAPLQEIQLNKPSAKRHLFHTSNIDRKHNSVHLKKPAMEQNIWQKSNHPHGIPKRQWEEVVSQDALASKTNHWEVDPIMDRVQYILNKPSTNLLSDQSSLTSGKDIGCTKSLSKLSLQEAFLHRKQDFISRCRERQKRLALSKDDRQMQECLRLEREAIFAEQERMGEANVYAHPYSDNLYQPKRRLLTKQEMKEMTARKYKNLPEVVEKKEENRRKIEYKLNRLRANLFNKKVQKEILKKRYKQRG